MALAARLRSFRAALRCPPSCFLFLLCVVLLYCRYTLVLFELRTRPEVLWRGVPPIKAVEIIFLIQVPVSSRIDTQCI